MRRPARLFNSQEVFLQCRIFAYRLGKRISDMVGLTNAVSTLSLLPETVPLSAAETPPGNPFVLSGNLIYRAEDFPRVFSSQQYA